MRHEKFGQKCPTRHNPKHFLAKPRPFDQSVGRPFLKKVQGSFKHHDIKIHTYYIIRKDFCIQNLNFGASSRVSPFHPSFFFLDTGMRTNLLVRHFITATRHRGRKRFKPRDDARPTRVVNDSSWGVAQILSEQVGVKREKSVDVPQDCTKRQ